MKVILLQDVAKIGRRHEVAEVPDGYALNMLIPKGMAEPATPENLKRQKARSQVVSAAVAASDSDFAVALEKLAGVTLTVAAEVNEQGHLFEALKPGAIVTSAAEHGAVLNEAQVVLPDPIKEAGTHTITLTHGQQSGVITINVEKVS